MNLLLSTKTQVPKTFGSLIERPRLLELMDRCLGVPVTLLSAPAGFGKTTLLCQWLRVAPARMQLPTHTAWLSLDEHDSRLDVFLSYFIAALRNVYPAACDRTLHLLAGSQVLSDDALSISLVNELGELETQPEFKQAHLVLVLDDYHAIEGHAVHALVTALLKHPSARLHLVLGCRHDPALPLARWRTQNQLLELRSKDLRLTHFEVDAFLKQAVPITWSDAHITAFEAKTEGWAAGLHLISLAVHEQAEVERLAAQLDAPPQHIANYLLEEVLARQPLDVQENILQLSILDRFSAELCEFVCQDLHESGAAFIARLVESNLFVVGLDSEGTWYRFHRLFQQLVRYQWKQRNHAAERAALHKRAMTWFADHNYIEDALTHAFAAGEITSAAEIVSQHRHRLMNQEQWQQLANWLAKFSNEMLAQYPDLLLTKAWFTRTLNFDLEVTGALTQNAADALAAREFPPKRATELGAEIDTLHALEAYRRTDPDRVIALAGHALQVLPAESYLVRSYAHLHLAAAHQMKGDLARGVALMRQAQTEEILSGYGSHARAAGGEAMLQWMAGNLPAMLERSKHMVAVSALHGQHDSTTWGRYFVAAAAYMRNDLATAELHAATALNDPNPSGSFRPTVDSALILACVYQAKNMPERAREVLDEALVWAAEKHSEALTQTVQAFQAELALRQGNLGMAQRWYLAYGDLPIAGAMANFSSPLLTIPKVLLAQNMPARNEQAAEFLERLYTHLSAKHNVRFCIDTLALRALAHDAVGDQTRALATLQQALTMAEPGGFIRVFVDLGMPMARLLQLLEREHSASVYVQEILQAFPNAKPIRAPNQGYAPIQPLTEREYEILELLAKRQSNKEIARELVISPLTVKAHTDHIYQKLGVNSRQDAVKTARELGLLDYS